MTARLAGRTVEVGPLRLHVRTAGPHRASGSPVLLLPGLVSSSRYLEPLGRELASEHVVVAPDLPGTGRSPRAEHPLSLAELAAVLHGLLRRTTGPAVVVANSFGCLVAIELALRAPEAVQGLVLTSPVLAPRARSLAPLAVRFVRAMRHESPRYLAVLLTDVLRASSRRGRTDLRALLEDPVLERADRLTVPTLVVRGRHDHLVPRAFAERLAERIPAGDYCELDSSHALPFSSPRDVAALVRAADRGTRTP